MKIMCTLIGKHLSKSSMSKTNRKSSRKYLSLFLATTTLALNFWVWSLLSPLGTKYAEQFTLNPSNLAFLLAIPVLIGAIGRITFGVLTDKFGGRAMFILICLISSIAAASLIFAESYPHLLICAVLLGVSGATFVIGIPYLSAWFPASQRGLVLGIYSLGNAGTAISGFMTPMLINWLGQDTTFLLIALLLLMTAVIFWVFGQNAQKWKPASGSSFMRLRQAAALRITWDLAITYGIVFGAFVAFGVYLPVLLKIVYNLSLTDAAARAAGFIVLATIARPIGGWLSDKLGGKVVVQSSLLLVCLLASFVAFQSTLTIHTTAAYLSLAFVLGCACGATFAMVGKLANPNIMGSVTGIVGAAGSLGGFIPPLILGVTYQFTNTYGFALLGLALSVIIVFVYNRGRFKKSTG